MSLEKRKEFESKIQALLEEYQYALVPNISLVDTSQAKEAPKEDIIISTAQNK